jgi:cellulose synthase/poly-beta-1,6-N-acetylglucosamine synthase-like glycosyltransferase/5-hydroxyisourate hydrolase-like protein (transthyretin family)
MARIYLVLLVIIFGTFSTFSLADELTESQNCKLLQGHLIDEKTGYEAEQVEIKIQNLDTKKAFKTRSDDNGVFKFSNIPLGKYVLVVSDKDYTKKSFEINLTTDHLKIYNADAFEIAKKVSWMFNWGDAFGVEHYWSHFVGKIVLITYIFCLILVFVYSLLQLSLTIVYAKNRKKEKIVKPLKDSFIPFITVQLPMYNELYVAERIIQKIAEFDYPRDRFEIQVLDDSTDETVEVIAKKVAEVAATGVDIVHIHRIDRTGYKAGALDAAMDKVKGEFIAIFDSDFVPEKDFLRKTVPYFENENIGVVQTRWGHINKDYSILTELQAFGLNGHFAIEQGGRNAAGHYINFNGTGGIWRKKCIEDAGGWEHDTLTEDLDLSYRAQIKGWKFTYLEDVIAPAELPITMSALKNQQHRWMKGGAECFRKMAWRIVSAKNVKFMDKVHGLSHLFNSSVFFFILLLSLLSLPILHIKDSFSDLNFFIQFGSIFILSTVFLMFYYWMSYRDKTANTFTSFLRFAVRFIQFLIVSMGLSLNNTVAVLEGYLGIKSSFVRTPKFNVASKTEFKGNKYDKKKISLLTIGEGFLMLLFGFTAVNRAIYGDFGMLPFHLMLATGYGLVFFYSIGELRTPKQ